MNYVYNIGKYLILLIILIVIVLSGRFTGLLHGPGLVFIFLGVIALALMSFNLDEMKDAFKNAAGRTENIQTLQKSAYFWEAMARNAWILGVLGSVINFVIALSAPTDGIGGISWRMSRSLITTLYGLIFGIVCVIPAMKLKQGSLQMRKSGLEDSTALSEPKTKKHFQVENFWGYLIFIAVFSWSIVSLLSEYPLRGHLNPINIFIYWPAVLVVLGGTIVLVLFIGRGASGLPVTLGFVLTGLIGSLTGFVQVLLAFSIGIIPDIASAISFIISSCFLVLLGMLLIGNPLEDKVVKAQKDIKPSMLSRLAWYIFPFLTIIFLLITFIMVVTPVQK